MITSVRAYDDVQPDIKSVEFVLDKYGKIEKAQLLLDLTVLYAKNNQWREFYKHLKRLYQACPDLKNTKVIFNSELKDNNIIQPAKKLSPSIVLRLQNLGVYNVKTKEDALTFLDILKPICNEKCSKYTENKLMEDF
jgi:hypothetical protein